MLSRYQRNSVYDEYGNIVIAQLPGDLPYMILECAELPQYKGDKKTVSGYYVDPVNPARSFGPALVAAVTGNTAALGSLWVFIVGPLAGAALAAVVYKFLEADEA